MVVKSIKFHDDTVKIVAEEIVSSKIAPEGTLIIAPSKRFFYYLAGKLIDFNKGGGGISPDLTTSDEVVTGILSNTSYPLANESEQFKMLILAIKNSDSYESIIPADSFKNYNAALSSVKKIHKLFGEILKNKMPDSITSFFDFLKKNKPEPYRGFNSHLEILISIGRNYEIIQKKEANYDPSFLISKAGKIEIDEYFENYKRIILVSPTALTNFEKQIYSAIKSKLIVITQDSETYDFSSIRDWPKSDDANPVYFNKELSSTNIYYSREPSLLYEVSRTLHIIDSEIKKGTNPNKILVLNIDNLFSEMLYDSLASHGISSNLSQGINVKREPLYHFFSTIAEFFTSHKSNTLIKLLKNQIFSDFSDINIFPKRINSLREFIFRTNTHLIYNFDNKIFEDYKDIKKPLEKLKVLYNSKDVDELYHNLNMILTNIGNKRSYEFSTFKKLIEETILDVSTFQKEINDSPYNIFLSILSTKKLPLIGSYNEGIQILGLLETRGISFKTVIIPSFNEGTFPSPSLDYRLFNSSLRRIVGLPGLYLQEDLEFYYLKRLIDSSERSYILFLTSQDGSSDIPSRYIYLFNPESIPEIDHSYILPSRQIGTIYMKQNKIDFPELNKRITEFSRLDIDRIKKCRTKYYIERILKITGENVLAEEVEANIIGSIIHRIFYELYKTLDNSAKTKINFTTEENLKSYLEKLVEKILTNDLFYTEEIGIVKEITKNICYKVLENDISRLKNNYIICNELSESTLTAAIGNGKYSLTGRIDRVDKTPDGKYMIIDYKTGLIPSNKSHTEENNFKEVQLGVYGLLFKKTYPDYPIDSLNYYSIQNNSIRNIINHSDIKLYLNNFEQHLVDLLDNFNLGYLPPLAEDLDSCKYCPFKNICRIIET